ncbi:MAG: hypothetical protein JO329_25110 [Planctomycetaceae bacterium]|nr:hypothetical protein [Planctomycetaceae bacterium]MBV8382433.1 hypothetical protein [Planctomycetaceae bacterium]MBV8554179.1 hypothetical protein [Planctomycetaceae bacterium]
MIRSHPSGTTLRRLPLLTLQPRSWDGQRHLEELALWTSDGRRDDPFQALDTLGLIYGQLMVGAARRPGSRAGWRRLADPGSLPSPGGR